MGTSRRDSRSFNTRAQYECATSPDLRRIEISYPGREQRQIIRCPDVKTALNLEFKAADSINFFSRAFDGRHMPNNYKNLHDANEDELCVVVGLILKESVYETLQELQYPAQASDDREAPILTTENTRASGKKSEQDLTHKPILTKGNYKLSPPVRLTEKDACALVVLYVSPRGGHQCILVDKGFEETRYPRRLESKNTRKGQILFYFEEWADCSAANTRPGRETVWHNAIVSFYRDFIRENRGLLNMGSPRVSDITNQPSNHESGSRESQSSLAESVAGNVWPKSPAPWSQSFLDMGLEACGFSFGVEREEFSQQLELIRLLLTPPTIEQSPLERDITAALAADAKAACKVLWGLDKKSKIPVTYDALYHLGSAIANGALNKNAIEPYYYRSFIVIFCSLYNKQSVGHLSGISIEQAVREAYNIARQAANTGDYFPRTINVPNMADLGAIQDALCSAFKHIHTHIDFLYRHIGHELAQYPEIGDKAVTNQYISDLITMIPLSYDAPEAGARLMELCQCIGVASLGTICDEIKFLETMSEGLEILIRAGFTVNFNQPKTNNFVPKEHQTCPEGESVPYNSPAESGLGDPDCLIIGEAIPGINSSPNIGKSSVAKSQQKLAKTKSTSPLESGSRKLGDGGSTRKRTTSAARNITSNETKKRKAQSNEQISSGNFSQISSDTITHHSAFIPDNRDSKPIVGSQFSTNRDDKSESTRSRHPSRTHKDKKVSEKHAVTTIVRRNTHGKSDAEESSDAEETTTDEERNSYQDMILDEESNSDDGSSSDDESSDTDESGNEMKAVGAKKSKSKSKSRSKSEIMAQFEAEIRAKLERRIKKEAKAKSRAQKTAKIQAKILKKREKAAKAKAKKRVKSKTKSRSKA